MSFETVTIGPCTLYRGDCLEILPTLSGIDAVVTDPPYGVGLTHKQHKWFRQDGDGYESFSDTPECVERIAVPAVTECVRMFGRVVVTPGTECLRMYPKADDIGCIYNRSGTGSGKWGFKCSTPVLFYGPCPYMARGLGRRHNSWEQSPGDFAEDCGHPCPKPLGMMTWLVERASIFDETVCDPMMGSGTTGVACIKTGRRFIGIEIEPKYFKIACKRIKRAWRDERSKLNLEPTRARMIQPELITA